MNVSDQKQWVVAVDGGGSKISVAAYLNACGAPPPDSIESARVWTFAQSGSAHPSNWHAAQQHLAAALSAVGHALTLSEAHGTVRHLLLSLAGAGREADRQCVLDWARTLPAPFDGASTSCVSDIEPLIDYRHDPTTSVAVILGTGSIVATRDRDRQMIRAGGWGPHLGDECSGGALGLAALRSVCEWLDTGGAPDTASPLVCAVLELLPHRQSWSIGRVEASTDLANASPARLKFDRDKLSSLLIEMATDRPSAATLAHGLLSLALEKKDAEASRLLKAHVERLSWQIEQVAQRAGSPTFELVFSGGLASNYAGLREEVVKACRARGLSPRGSVVAQPLLAALRLAHAQTCAL